MEVNKIRNQSKAGSPNIVGAGWSMHSKSDLREERITGKRGPCMTDFNGSVNNSLMEVT